MDIVVWLRSLGLGRYEGIFLENDIDETVLPSLTYENLKELVISSFGHRVKLLDAIVALRGNASGKTSSGDAATTSGAPTRRRNRPQTIPARRCKSGKAIPACALGSPPTTSKILGTPRRHEPRAPLARPGQGAASARPAGSGLRVVQVRHARSEGSEGAAGGIADVGTVAGPL